MRNVKAIRVENEEAQLENEARDAIRAMRKLSLVQHRSRQIWAPVLLRRLELHQDRRNASSSEYGYYNLLLTHASIKKHVMQAV